MRRRQLRSVGPFLEFEEKLPHLRRAACDFDLQRKGAFIWRSALGVGHGMSSWCPIGHFPQPLMQFCRLGVPHFVDIQDLDWGLSPERLPSIRNALTSYLERKSDCRCPRPSADMDPIVEVARSFGVFAEDAAGALGSEYCGRNADVGDAGIFILTAINVTATAVGLCYQR